MHGHDRRSPPETRTTTSFATSPGGGGELRLRPAVGGRPLTVSSSLPNINKDLRRNGHLPPPVKVQYPYRHHRQEEEEESPPSAGTRSRSRSRGRAPEASSFLAVDKLNDLHIGPVPQKMKKKGPSSAVSSMWNGEEERDDYYRQYPPPPRRRSPSPCYSQCQCSRCGHFNTSCGNSPPPPILSPRSPQVPSSSYYQSSSLASVFGGTKPILSPSRLNSSMPLSYQPHPQQQQQLYYYAPPPPPPPQAVFYSPVPPYYMNLPLSKTSSSSGFVSGGDLFSRQGSYSATPTPPSRFSPTPPQQIAPSPEPHPHPPPPVVSSDDDEEIEEITETKPSKIRRLRSMIGLNQDLSSLNPNQEPQKKKKNVGKYQSLTRLLARLFIFLNVLLIFFTCVFFSFNFNFPISSYLGAGYDFVLKRLIGYYVMPMGEEVEGASTYSSSPLPQNEEESLLLQQILTD